jgi:predicted ferric reductase
MNRSAYAFWRQIWYLAFAAGAVAILAFWWRATGHTTAASAASINLALGNTTGLLAVYLILWQLVLLGRLTVLENVFGLEKLTWLHKWNGYGALTAILLHTFFLMEGYGAINHTNIWAQLVDFMLNWDDVLKATLGTILFLVIVVISIGIVRRGFKYETWYYVHIFNYLAILLAFGHQMNVGNDFQNQPAFQAFWWALYLVALGLLTWYRFWLPTYLVLRHRLKVEKIVQETPDVLSVYVTGQGMDRIKFKTGQFMIWRFLDRDHWWQAHPFSLSAGPNGQYLRLTCKQLGDFTKSLSNLQPGTWVSVDGPHGNFTPDRLASGKLLLIAGGVGITPIRSMLEGLPPMADVMLVYAARNQGELALRGEIESLAAANHVTVRYLLSEETVPGIAHGFLDAANLSTLVPDASAREVMLCGPPPMMSAVTKTLVAAGISPKSIHTERFAY